MDNMLAKLGLTEKADNDVDLIQDLLKLMQENQSDFTLGFRHLSDLVDPGTASGDGVESLFGFSEAFSPWLARWRQRLNQDPQDAAARQQAMYAVNPVFIPRNHLVEEAISAAENSRILNPSIHSLIFSQSLSSSIEIKLAMQHHPSPSRWSNRRSVGPEFPA